MSKINLHGGSPMDQESKVTDLYNYNSQTYYRYESLKYIKLLKILSRYESLKYIKLLKILRIIIRTRFFNEANSLC